MTLKDCTKEELFYIIEYMRRSSMGYGDRHITRAIGEIERMREEKKIEQAEKESTNAAQWHRKYFEIMRPYADKKIADIPLPVWKKAREFLRKARAADARYSKLMGIRTGGGQ